jgi:circadian clock protein KaiB
MNKFRLFITGKTPKYEEVIRNLKEFLDEEFDGQYSLETISVIESPRLAESNMIFATPTLIKVYPPPIRKIVGDMSNRNQVLVGLGLVRRE